MKRSSRTHTASDRVSCALQCLPVTVAPPRLWLPASPYLLRPCSRARQAACHARAVVTPNDSGFDQVRWNRVGVTPAKQQQVLPACLDGHRRSAKNAELPWPTQGATRWMLNSLHPPQGGFKRPSNIMRDYAQSIRHTSPQTARAAWRLVCALRRIISIMCKWPRRSRSIRRVANLATQEHRNLFPPTWAILARRLQPRKRRASFVPAGPSSPTPGKSKTGEVGSSGLTGDG